MTSESVQKKIIIDEAARLFSRFGLEKTTMEDIAKAARKSKSSLYYYFKSKEDVFAAVIEKEIQGLKLTLARAIEPETDPCKKLKKFVMTRLEYLNRKADQYITVKDEHLKHYAFIQNLTAAYSEWEIATIKAIMEYGRKTGGFDFIDGDSTARAVFFALKGLEYPWTTNLTKKEIKDSTETLLHILINGITRK